MFAVHVIRFSPDAFLFAQVVLCIVALYLLGQLGLTFLVDVSDIFYFFRSGEGRGVRGAGRGQVGFFFLMQKSQEGGGVSPGGGRGRGAGRVSEGNWRGGGQIFFFTAEIPTKL